MTRYIAACLLLALTLALPFAVRAADDPPADAAAAVSADAKAVGAAVKHSAKAVAKSAKEGARQAAEAAKGVAHDVSEAAKQRAQEVATAAKRGAQKARAAVKPRKAAKESNTSTDNSDGKRHGVLAGTQIVGRLTDPLPAGCGRRGDT